MRPHLDKHISLDDFQAYYWLKKELIVFCKDNNILATGGKQKISDRIELFLKTGEKIISRKSLQKKNIKKQSGGPPTLKSRLTGSYKNDSLNRQFFKSIIGDKFKFNVIFMKWVKENPNKTYEDAINEWLKIEKDKKSGKKYKIGSQFEYNQYTRDFFASNPNRTRSDAIKCWKYKKSLPGSNKYEKSDLTAIKD